jgi:hypothetical protein
MATTKGRRRDEGGSISENKGRIEGPHGDTDMDRALEELENEGLAAGGRGDVERALGASGAGRREEIASNPDNEEALAEEALGGASEEEDEAQTHDRKRRR